MRLLLCVLGFHRWEYAGRPNTRRTCIRCKRREFLEDGCWTHISDP